MIDDKKDGMTTGSYASIIIPVIVIMFGIGTLVGVVYANATTATRHDYESIQRNCGELADTTRLVDGVVGLTRQQLNQTHVAICENTSHAEYHHQRVDSMRTTPFNPIQWILYIGAGGSAVIGGVALGRQRN